MIRHFSFDGYKQDQTLVLSHYQDPDGSRTGLTISDRPSHSILDAQTQLGLAPGASRAELSADFDALPEEGRAARLRELYGTARAYFGTSRDQDSILVLMDGAGRSRIVLEAPLTGEPSIRILDEEGEIVSRLPD